MPVAAEDLKAYFKGGRRKGLPNIPHTGAQTMKKKNLTDLGPGHHKSIILDSVYEESDQKPGQEQNITVDDSEYENSNTTVFDLVHRGRQRDQHFRKLRAKNPNQQVCSPKIMTGMSSIISENHRATLCTNSHSRSTRGLQAS